jgi:stage IV sporulation protein A
MVLTPWSEESLPFDKAAEIGTRKVIRDHSTIGVLVTCDGSFGELSRENYVESEARIAAELHEIQKPFVIVLNSAHPEKEESVALALSLEEKYRAPVALVNCLELDKNDIRHILELVLLEFPVTEISVELPDFMNALDRSHPICRSVHETISACASEITKTGDIAKSFAKASENTYVKDVRISRIDLGTGKATVSIELADGLFYGLIGELTGFSIEDDEALLKLLLELSDVKKQYDKVKKALDDVNTSGYGIVVPDIYDMKLEEPQMVKQTGGYGVKLHASAPSIHMIKADIEAEVSPIVGTEQQSEELVNFLLREFETDPRKIWDTNMFGKSLYELINEGLHNKLAHIPDDARTKLSETLSRIINEGSGGLICIIL